MPPPVIHMDTEFNPGSMGPTLTTEPGLLATYKRMLFFCDIAYQTAVYKKGAFLPRRLSTMCAKIWSPAENCAYPSYML